MEDRIISLLSELVRINSVNPTLSGGPGESEAAEFIRHFLDQLKLDTEIQTVAPNRKNVVSLISGAGKHRSLLLNGHLDTVGVEDMPDPFSLKRQGDRLCGRGAYDMKGSLALMLLLAEHFAGQPPPIAVWLTFTADEEDRSIGMEHLVDKWLPGGSRRPSGAIFLEPTELDIGICHKGFTWFEIEVTGKAAHGSRPSQGIDAILPLKAALEELSNLQSELCEGRQDPLLGHASLHPSIIAGGTEFSVIPGASKLYWERRTLPGEFSVALDSELQRVIKAVQDIPGDHQVAGREVFVRQAYRVPGDAEIIQRLKAASPASQLVGMSFWADSAVSGLAGIPSVLFGPAGNGAHAVDEWVSLKSLIRVHQVLQALIEQY
jgi:acetylornithine deacetylase